MIADLVFIDGTHDYPNAWFDSMAWGRKLQRDGLLALHDATTHDGPRRVVQYLLGNGLGRRHAQADSLVVLRIPNPNLLPDPEKPIA